MKNRDCYFIALTAVLASVAITGHAFTLGDLRGSAVIGRSLDVSVPVVAAAGEEVLASCMSVDILFGDLRQLITSIALVPVNSGQVPMTMVRIKSGSVVNEPIVTVVLRSTCGSTTTRRYVLMTDFPATDLPKTRASPVAGRLLPPAASRQSKATLQGAAGADVATPAATAPAFSESGRVRSRATHARPVTHKSAALVKKRPKPVSPSVKAVPSPQSEADRPVLKLERSLVLPVVQGETPGPAAPPDSAAARAPSEEALQQAMRIEALQSDIKVLKDLAQKTEASLAEFQPRLRQAEAERVSSTWFYLLAGLLVAILTTLTWVLRKQQVARKSDDTWWQQVKADPSETVAISPSSTPAPPVSSTDVVKPYVRVAPVAPVVPVAVAAPVSPESLPQTDVDVGLDIDLGGLAPADEPPSASRPLAMLPADGYAIAHSLNVDNVSDIRLQAEFFVSLGQIERALDVLRKQMLESPQPNPLVYLDLLTLYHSQGMKSYFYELRAAFCRFFNAVVPDFSAFNLVGRDLLDYPEPLAVLVRFWPTIEAIAFLEACIFRSDAAPMQLSFDLAAFRDLLMLHDVAEKVTSDFPWKMTHLGGLGEPVTGPAEWAGLVMDMRGKAGN